MEKEYNPQQTEKIKTYLEKNQLMNRLVMSGITFGSKMELKNVSNLYGLLPPYKGIITFVEDKNGEKSTIVGRENDLTKLEKAVGLN
jgi:hypothetical protein